MSPGADADIGTLVEAAHLGGTAREVKSETKKERNSIIYIFELLSYCMQNGAQFHWEHSDSKKVSLLLYQILVTS